MKRIILSVVLYGCGTLSLTFRDEHRIRVFDNRRLKRVQVIGGSIKMHNEKLRNVYPSRNTYIHLSFQGGLDCQGKKHAREIRGIHRGFDEVGRKKATLRGTRRTLKDNTKIDLTKKIGWDDMALIHLILMGINRESIRDHTVTGFDVIRVELSSTVTMQKNAKLFFQLAGMNIFSAYFVLVLVMSDCLCGLVVRVFGYRSGGPDSIPGTTRKKKQWVWHGVHSAS
jgi:hypothetical protein